MILRSTLFAGPLPSSAWVLFREQYLVSWLAAAPCCLLLDEEEQISRRVVHRVLRQATLDHTYHVAWREQHLQVLYPQHHTSSSVTVFTAVIITYIIINILVIITIIITGPLTVLVVQHVSASWVLLRVRTSRLALLRILMVVSLVPSLVLLTVNTCWLSWSTWYFRPDQAQHTGTSKVWFYSFRCYTILRSG